MVFVSSGWVFIFWGLLLFFKHMPLKHVYIVFPDISTISLILPGFHSLIISFSDSVFYHLPCLFWPVWTLLIRTTWNYLSVYVEERQYTDKHIIFSVVHHRRRTANSHILRAFVQPRMLPIFKLILGKGGLSNTVLYIFKFNNILHYVF